MAGIHFFADSAAQLTNLGPLLVDRLIEPAFRAACLDINRLREWLLEVATDATTHGTFPDGFLGCKSGWLLAGMAVCGLGSLAGAMSWWRSRMGAAGASMLS